MQCPAYGGDIESPDVQGKGFGSSLDQREILRETARKNSAG
jgi:hypothetical protein